MSIEVHILGTSSARPTNIRQVSGSVVSCSDGLAVVDAGEGFQNRFLMQRKRMKTHSSYHLKNSKIGVLCLTHGHLDHTWGVLPWLQSMSLDNRSQPLLIIGPTSPQVIEALIAGKDMPEDTPHSDLSLQFQFWHKLGGKSSNLGYQVRWVLGDIESDIWIEVNPDSNEIKELNRMPQPEGWRANKITPLKTVHSIPSCAWRISAKGKPGKFNKLKAIELGLSGDDITAIAKGNDIVHDGKTLKAADFRSDKRRDLSVIISGDTSEMAEGITEISECDVLIHEATFLNDWQQHAEDYLHSTSSGAARTALACNASHLVLTHYGARIKTSHASLEEANEVIAGKNIQLTAANDGDRVVVDDEGSTSHLYWIEDGWTAMDKEAVN